MDKSILQISSQNIKMLGFSKSVIKNKRVRINKKTYFLNSPELLKSDLKRKDLYIVLEQENIYTKNITIPQISRNLIYDLLEYELINSFNSIENIIYSYKVIKEDEENIEILIYYCSSDSLKFLRSMSSANIKHVSLIQFCAATYFSSRITDKKYILTIYFNKYMYLLYICEEKLLANKVIRTLEKENYDVSKIYNQLNFEEGELNVYFASLDEDYSIDSTEDNYNYISLGKVSLERIYETVVLGEKQHGRL
ncbi:MAG: hypothetical protein Q8936_01560 [Bacillota bacterium]|nr:hypothetical protein [Bacillota bacterium]